MAERSSKRKKSEHDFAVTAYRVFQEAVGDKEKAEEKQPEPSSEECHAAAIILGRRGGLKGGKARAAKLSKKRRTEIAKKAAEARWKRKYPA